MIGFHGVSIFRLVLTELLDRSPSSGVAEEIRVIASGVEGVLGTHKCHIRKLGVDLVVDLDILVPGTLTVSEGHELAHKVQDAVRDRLPLVFKVLVHVEPIEADSQGNPRGKDTPIPVSGP